MIRIVTALLLLGALASLAPAGARADVKEKADRALPGKRAEQRRRVAAAQLPVERACRGPGEIGAAISAATATAAALPERLRARAAAVEKAGGGDAKLAEQARELTDALARLSKAIDALAACPPAEEAALAAALRPLVVELHGIELTAGDVEEIAFVLDSEALHAAIDSLGDALFDLSLAIFAIDQARDELDGKLGDDRDGGLFEAQGIALETE